MKDKLTQIEQISKILKEKILKNMDNEKREFFN